MITIKTSESYHTLYIRLEVCGHAGQAEPGKDIVCSAVSILTYTFAHIVNDMETADELFEGARIELSDGSAEIQAKCRTLRSFEKAANALHVVVKGYRLLETRYPEYVKFIDEA